MPYLVSTSVQAERDIDDIFSFIKADTSDRAADWFNGLLNQDTRRDAATLPRNS
jgi:plasmid stabilization system protein ParE